MTRAEQSAVLLGATGAVGGHVLTELLRLPVFAKVTTVGRRRVELPVTATVPEKLVQHVIDLEDPASYRERVAGHTAAICTLGVGEPSKLKREEVWKVDVDYAVGFATVCREEGVSHFTLMTAVGADPASSVDYMKMKGTVEERVKALGFARTSFFRPSMLLTPENRYGTSQALLLAVWPKIHWMLAGPLRHYRGIRVEDLGRAIAMNAARAAPPGVEVFEWDAFQRLARGEAP